MYSPCLFVYLYIGRSDCLSKNYGRIWDKFSGEVSHHPGTIPLYFGADPDSVSGS